MRQNPPKQPGIKDIAAALGVSIATVDRVLHSRGGAKPATRDRVLRMAEKLGYKPNIAARTLKLNRRLRIAVQLPKEISHFFGHLREGVRTGAAGSSAAGVEIYFADYLRLGHGGLELLEAALSEKYDGLICTPSDAAKARPIIDELQRGGTAVVCVASDAPHSERLSSIAIDGYISGSVAAELLIHALPSSCPVAAMTGDLHIADHTDKLRGFAATLATLAPHISLLPVVEFQENPEKAYSQTKELLERNPDVAGIYVSTANYSPVLRAVRDKKYIGRIRIITTDILPELVQMVGAGEIMATLYQRPFTQGRVAIQSLLEFLVGGIRPDPIIRLTPHIVLRGNLPAFAGYASNPQPRFAD